MENIKHSAREEMSHFSHLQRSPNPDCLEAKGLGPLQWPYL